MNMKNFGTQKEAIEYYGHSWKYIEKHYNVSRCFTSQGFRGYFISKNQKITSNQLSSKQYHI